MWDNRGMLAPRRLIAALVVALIMAVLPSIATAAVMISTSVGTTDYPLGGSPVAVDPGFAVWDDASPPTAAWIDYVTVVASPHRDRAYIVSRALIDSIKQDVPIWKAERYESGRVWNANRDALKRSS